MICLWRFRVLPIYCSWVRNFCLSLGLSKIPCSRHPLCLFLSVPPSLLLRFSILSRSMLSLTCMRTNIASEMSFNPHWKYDQSAWTEFQTINIHCYSSITNLTFQFLLLLSCCLHIYFFLLEDFNFRRRILLFPATLHFLFWIPLSTLQWSGIQCGHCICNKHIRTNDCEGLWYRDGNKQLAKAVLGRWRYFLKRIHCWREPAL